MWFLTLLLFYVCVCVFAKYTSISKQIAVLVLVQYITPGLTALGPIRKLLSDKASALIRSSTPVLSERQCFSLSLIRGKEDLACFLQPV